MFNSSQFNRVKFNSSRTIAEIIVQYFNAVINLVHAVKENVNLISKQSKINLNPRKYR